MTKREVRWYNLPRWWALTMFVDFRDYERGGPRAPLTKSLWPPDVTEPIFIVGSPRSGTSFLGSCLGRMPSVSYHREPVLTKGVASRLFDGSLAGERAAAVLRRTATGLLWLHRDHGKRYVEKNPVNVFLVPQLAQAFPDARFVHIVRDGRDVALSLLDHPWIRQVFGRTRRRDPSGRAYGPWPYFFTDPDRRSEFLATSDFHRAVWVWRDYVSAAERGLSAIEPERSLTIRYEDLVASPFAVGERLLEGLSVSGGPDRDALLTALRLASGRSLGRARGELGPLEVATVRVEIHEYLERLGYDVGPAFDRGDPVR